MSELRLIQRTYVLQGLLAAVAAGPAGQKLSIPRLRDALVNQSDVITGIETLIAAGELDRATLRPPERRVPLGDRRFRENREKEGNQNWRRLDDVEAGVIRKEILAFLDRSGMRPCRFGREALRDPKFVGVLEHRTVVGGPTAERLRAFIADRDRRGGTSGDQGAVANAPGLANGPASEREARTPDTAPPIKVPDGIRKVRPYCTQPGACVAPARGPCRVCQIGSFGGQRIDARAERQSAATRRGIGREAEKRLDGEKVAGAASPAVLAAMNLIADRRAAEARQTDPVEQAKLTLQRKGRVVYSASVHGGRSDRFHVSGERDGNGRLKELTPAALLDLAERVTGQSFRRQPVSSQTGGC